MISSEKQKAFWRIKAAAAGRHGSARDFASLESCVRFVSPQSNTCVCVCVWFFLYMPKELSLEGCIVHEDPTPLSFSEFDHGRGVWMGDGTIDVSIVLTAARWRTSSPTCTIDPAV